MTARLIRGLITHVCDKSFTLFPDRGVAFVEWGLMNLDALVLSNIKGDCKADGDNDDK